MTSGGATTSFVYAPDGERLNKIASTGTTTYFGPDIERSPTGEWTKYVHPDAGNYAHAEVAGMLQRSFRDVPFRVSVGAGQRGVDVMVPQQFVGEVGFGLAEIKPLSTSGEASLARQVRNWSIDPKSVRAITYDSHGNVYFGFNR